MEITYSENLRDNVTVNPTDSYAVHNKSELWHTGQQASCPLFFLPEATKTANLSHSSSRGCWLSHAASRFIPLSSWGHQMKPVADTGDNKNFQSWTILLVSWFYSQQRKILPNTGNILAKSEWAGNNLLLSSLKSQRKSSKVQSPPVVVGRPTGFTRLWHKASAQRADGDEALEAWRWLTDPRTWQST